MKHVRLALGRSGVGGRFPRRRRRRRRRCRRRLRRCRHILGIPFRPGAIFSSVAGGGGESFDYIPTVTNPWPCIRVVSLVLLAVSCIPFFFVVVTYSLYCRSRGRCGALLLSYSPTQVDVPWYKIWACRNT